MRNTPRVNDAAILRDSVVAGDTDHTPRVSVESKEEAEETAEIMRMQDREGLLTHAMEVSMCLHTYICMCVYFLCKYVYIYMYVCVFICVCIYISIYIYVYVKVYVYAYTYIYIYVYIYICIYVYICTYIFVYICSECRMEKSS